VADLYAAGWRQGSILDATLEVTVLEAGEAGVVPNTTSFPRWVVCTQDCDLASAAADSDDELVELRPVLQAEPPKDWGIRSRRFLLTENDYVDAAFPRCFISPKALAQSIDPEIEEIEPARARAFKTWLGRRYDRPAVPEHLVPIAKEVASRCGTKSGRDIAARVHDVLMQFDDSTRPPRVALFAVVHDDADPDEVRKWLADASTRIRQDLGVVAAIEAGTRAEASLELLESSYSADLSQLTWRNQEPTGAE
jgi:hypothetical protein